MTRAHFEYLTNFEDGRQLMITDAQIADAVFIAIGLGAAMFLIFLPRLDP